MTIKSYFFNALETGNTYDRIYNAEDVTSYLDLLVGNGVFPNPSTNLQVRADSGMNIIVGAGQGWINGHKLINSADLQLTVSQSDVVLDRIDRVIFYVDHSARDMGIEILKGTSSGPVPLTRNDTRYEMNLAYINVARQTTEITPAMITDSRGNSAVCGYVQGLIQQMDTTTMFEQWQAGFENWFNEVKDDLVTATLIRKYAHTYITESANEATFNVKELLPEYAWGLDILEIRINGLALNTSEFVKNENEVTINAPIEQPGTPIEFVIYKSVDGSDCESVVDMVYELQNELDITRITNATGTVQTSLTDSTANVLQAFVDMGIGFHTLYANATVQNVPGGKSARFFGHLTDLTNGYIYAVNEDGSTYVNCVINGEWQRWKTLYEANPALLWEGASYPNNGITITPVKKLSECRNGWLLTFSASSNARAQDNMIQTCMIPKEGYNGDVWNGSPQVFSLTYAVNSSTGALSQCVKVFDVYDDRIVSTPNNVTTVSQNMMLRSIQEY